MGLHIVVDTRIFNGKSDKKQAEKYYHIYSPFQNHRAERFVDGDTMLLIKNGASRKLAGAGYAEVGKISNHYCQKRIVNRWTIAHWLQQYAPAHSSYKMRKNAENNRIYYP